jgi:AcrR family transcriptional regulator
MTSPQASKKPDWREARGLETRATILDAAIQCIVRDGYARLRTTTIAAQSKVSRGAMLHHFPSKEAIVYATVQHLYDKRLRAYEHALAAASGSSDRIKRAFDAYWEHVNHPYFIAFFELIVAARTDTDLHAVMAPLHERFEQATFDHALGLFPELTEKQDRLRVGLQLSNALMEHLALNGVFRKPGVLVREARAFLEQTLRSYYELEE